MDSTAKTEEQDISFVKRTLSRLRELLGLNRTPDTTEDLEHEIQELLEEGEEQGLITSQEGRMINSIFEFRDTLASEIMTPRSDMVCAEFSMAVEELISLINQKGFTRIPIYAETTDNIIGILHAKDLLLGSQGSEASLDVAQLVKPAYFVLENKRLVDLLRDFQARKIHMAIVTDEFGGVRGLVTLEDVLEEIVGEIDDEYDKNEKRWRQLDDGSLFIYAKIDIEEVESFFKVSLPEGPYESVGGLLIHQLGHLPEKGESVEVESLVFQVVSATKRHIKTVRIWRK